jgi:16S rRNA C967 or C1407 C5-methylase (RsmB/RsmF family)/NOL1/NOP2/fmu family ribosome biogenesis protein
LPFILPKELLTSLEGLPGFEAAAFEQVHAAGPQVTSIRLNPAKIIRADIAGDTTLLPEPSASPKAGLQALPAATPIPWSTYGFYLAERPSFTFDPSFHAGTYYVQEASSMFLEQALRQTTDLSRPLRVLDLCAAPGGKSTLLQSLLSPDSLLVSNEVIKTRVHVLQENMTKWGAVNTFITNNDPKDFQRLENYFDVIVVDAPCSGSGLFRRDPDAIGEWSLDNVQLCQQRQRRILADCWPALRQDGMLIYSTCSYSKEEDEDILEWMTAHLDATGCRLQLNPEWNIVESEGKNNTYGYRFYPDKLKGEGFFISCLRKNDGSTYTPPRKRKLPERPAKQEEQRIAEWVRPQTPLFLFRHQELIYGLPEPLAAELPVIQSACYLKRAGVPMGQLSPKEFIPEHDLALSTLIDPQLPAISLSREQALAYLRKDDIHLDGTRRGWTLVQYEGHNLGWVKVLPNRTNNYYPKEWRILKREP